MQQQKTANGEQCYRNHRSVRVPVLIQHHKYQVRRAFTRSLLSSWSRSLVASVLDCEQPPSICIKIVKLFVISSHQHESALFMYMMHSHRKTHRIRPISGEATIGRCADRQAVLFVAHSAHSDCAERLSRLASPRNRNARTILIMVNAMKFTLQCQR